MNGGLQHEIRGPICGTKGIKAGSKAGNQAGGCWGRLGNSCRKALDRKDFLRAMSNAFFHAFFFFFTFVFSFWGHIQLCTGATPGFMLGKPYGTGDHTGTQDVKHGHWPHKLPQLNCILYISESSALNPVPRVAHWLEGHLLGAVLVQWNSHTQWLE